MAIESPVTDQAEAPFPLKSIGPSGRVPKQRLTSALKAQSIYWILHRANESRNAHGTFVQGMFDGNPPYNSVKMRQQGQAWRSNFNTMEGKARKDAAKSPYYDLFSSAPMYADVRTKKRSQVVTADTASRIISEEFDDMLSGWPGFDYNIWMMLDDFVGFSRGWLMWLTEDSWHFKRIPWWKVMFPDGTGVDSEEWSLFCVEHVFDPTKLNEYIEDEAMARDRGWNPAQVREAIKLAVPLDPNSMRDTMEVQRAIRDQDIYITTRAASIQAASIFVRQFDGTWSRMIVECNTKITDDDWLYFKEDVGDEVHKLLAPFFFDVENGSLNGLGGLGRDIYDVIKAKDRMRNEQLNNVFLRCGILVQAQTAGSLQRLGQIQIGAGMHVIPNGLLVQQSTIIGDIESTLAVNRDLDNMLDVNTGIYRPTFEKPAGNPETATAAQLRFSQATVLTNSAVNRFYQQLDRFYQEVYRRASSELPDSNDEGIKSAREFQKRCRERGVSNEQLRNPCSVRAMRSTGNGSPAMRQQMTAELGQVVPQLSQRGQQAWLEDFIAARGGQHKVERYLPIEDQQNVPTEQDREALQENASVKIGAPVVIVENDNHIVHLTRHFQAVDAAFEAVNQGAPPQDAAAFVGGILPHIEQHIQLVPFQHVQKIFVDKLREAQSDLADLISIIEQATPDPQQQQRVMSELELRQIETQAKIADKQVKTAAGIQDKNVKTQQSLAIADAQAAAQITRDNLVTQAKIQNERRKAAAKPKTTSND